MVKNANFHHVGIAVKSIERATLLYQNDTQKWGGGQHYFRYFTER
jgi:hypothetical protein